MVVTSNGRPVAILSSVDESNLEENLDAIRQVRATAAVTKLQSAAASRGMDKLSADDVRAEIRAVRRARSK
ncbi:MAG TPA: type II toxin-antitoxin system Phd/YefM family antitoxin [Kiritimatiellia bacterium]|nr:type II toxin-antitoxin system Phd/YefM family antitoxin [Kiritimatiellia bacterium]